MIIYKATNKINGKIYIGQTIQKLNDRIYDHIRKSNVHNSKSHFHCAIRKHGKESFTWEIIDRVSKRELLSPREIYWIKFYNSIDRKIGYNLTTGGETCIMSKESRRKISLAGKGRVISKAQREKQRLTMLGENNHFYGKKHSKESLKQISKSRKGKGLGQTKLQKEKCQHRGSSNGMTKITEEQARQVKIHLLKPLIAREISEITNVSVDTIYQIKYGKVWKHVII